MMVAWELVDRRQLVAGIERLFADPRAAYLHVHFAALLRRAGAARLRLGRNKEARRVQPNGARFMLQGAIDRYCARGAAGRSLRTTTPPFMTNLTCSISFTSTVGLPDTAMMSANLPFSIEPICCSMS